MNYGQKTNEELAVLYQEGDSEAAGELLERNVAFIYSVLNRFRAEFKASKDLIPDEDLFQEGAAAFLEAALDFNAPAGAKLTTYALRHMRGRMVEAMKQNLLIEFRNDGAQEQIAYIRMLQKTDLDLEAEFVSGGYEQDFDEAEDKKIEHHEILSSEEYRVFTMRLGLDAYADYGRRTAKEVAKELGLSVPTVNRRYYSARDKIRDSFGKYDFWVGIPEDVLKDLIELRNRINGENAKKYGWG